ncbi:translation initiation factor IF-2 [Ktedonosporobacter rubrisoli]|uniref:Translation initiation factor IF-2 n=1 Tax=Ktedonosporobacter rubrisoli TaxID=2509675 RepID=A0A4V0Z051_KTERU|nr:translation initiation factor IF-2 [Ktedonosporobacter rubrisoli]QBD82001.1 translation initiation factor IF-2 [Ktedonosporobacter rubrisoli]
MRDTSEFPDATEQAKQPNQKARTQARSKTESTTPGSQEQEAKPAARRRPSYTSHGSTRGQGGSEHTNHGNAPASSATRPVSAQHNHTATPAQRNNSGNASTTQGQGQHRPPTGPRQGGSPNPNQRSGNAPSHGPRSNSGHAPSGGPRPAPSYRGGPGGPRRQSGPGGPSTQQANHTATVQRPGPRPASSGGPSRPGGQNHRPPARHGSRGGSSAQKTQEKRAAALKEKPTGPVSIPPQIIVKDLAELLHATPNEIIRGLIKHSVFASINQVVDYDKAALVAIDLGFTPSPSTVTANSSQGLSASEAMMAAHHDDQTVIIPPVVTIMGHVDHGKTTLLDVIRKTKVAAGEVGGITQHIGAYQVEVNGKKITFLDTPGHEAFTAMRARGAQVAHIAIIVIAADDGIMPQTREAIDHARAAKMPIIIALNKIDRPNANPDRVKQQLAEIGIMIEEYGGETILVPVSARQGIGIDDLLDYILLVAELQDIRANPNLPATGVIIEARLEKNSGAMATVLVQQGTLKMGDSIVVGPLAGKVRAMFNDRGKRIQKAPPSTPVSIMGLSEVPQTGDRLEVTSDERAARLRAQQEVEKRRNESAAPGQVSLDTLYMQMQEGKVKELNVVLKCDVQGSAEAIKNSLTKVGEENLKVRLIREGIGNVSETDVYLAAASGAIIIAFNVKTDGAALREAQKEGIDIRYYEVIYQLIDDIQAALNGLLEPSYREVLEGHAEILQTFKAGKNTVIAGCRISDGKISRSSQARVLRAGDKVYEGKIASLRRGKDDVREVNSGYECGIILENFTELEVGDIIEAFIQERVKPGS